MGRGREQPALQKCQGAGQPAGSSHLRDRRPSPARGSKRGAGSGRGRETSSGGGRRRTPRTVDGVGASAGRARDAGGTDGPLSARRFRGAAPLPPSRASLQEPREPAGRCPRSLSRSASSFSPPRFGPGRAAETAGRGAGAGGGRDGGGKGVRSALVAGSGAAPSGFWGRSLGGLGGGWAGRRRAPQGRPPFPYQAGRELPRHPGPKSASAGAPVRAKKSPSRSLPGAATGCPGSSPATWPASLPPEVIFIAPRRLPPSLLPSPAACLGIRAM